MTKLASIECPSFVSICRGVCRMSLLCLISTCEWKMSENKSQASPNKTGLLAVGIFGGLATGIMALSIPFVMPAFRRVVLPYVPATGNQIDNVLKALSFKRPFDVPARSSRSPSLIDLGSGDGRIVIECAKHGIHSLGVELNPWLVLYSKYRAYIEGVHRMASFQRKNLFKIDLSEYDKIVIFGVDTMMPLIEEKVRDDCNRSNRSVTLIACRFPLPNWQPFVTFGSGIDQVWLYRYYPTGSSHLAAPAHTTL